MGRAFALDYAAIIAMARARRLYMPVVSDCLPHVEAAILDAVSQGSEDDG